MWDLLLVDCHAATMAAGGAPYGAIENAAIGVIGDRLDWIGPAKDLPDRKAAKTISLGGAWATPGLIDCHTHLVFGGHRAGEWEMRRSGVPYQEIAAAGGGILSTVKATRQCDEDGLVKEATARAKVMARQGVTTLEIKSGYGLDLANEAKMLRAAARLSGFRISRSFLGAHALPKEVPRDAYVDQICNEMIPFVAREKLADCVDGFCETIAFTRAEMDRIFTAARAHGLAVRLHAEQLSDMDGARLAASHAALSADHLEYLSEDGIAAMARAGTVAVLLPCAFYFMRETRKPPVAALRQARVPIAIATDCNPGTSPVAAPLIALNMACTLFDLTPEEALAGMTRNGAKALGLGDEIGTLEAGKSADLAVWNISHPAELCYWIGADLLQHRYFRGRHD